VATCGGNEGSTLSHRAGRAGNHQRAQLRELLLELAFASGELTSPPA
jgi:hypothetical protein